MCNQDIVTCSFLDFLKACFHSLDRVLSEKVYWVCHYSNIVAILYKTSVKQLHIEYEDLVLIR